MYTTPPRWLIWNEYVSASGTCFTVNANTHADGTVDRTQLPAAHALAHAEVPGADDLPVAVTDDDRRALPEIGVAARALAHLAR